MQWNDEARMTNDEGVTNWSRLPILTLAHAQELYLCRT